MIAGSIEIQMNANLARIAKDMHDAKALVTDTAHGINQAAEQIKSALEFAGVAIGIHEIVDQFDQLIERADAMGKLGERLGATPEWLSGLVYQAKLASVNADDLTIALSHMAAQASAAAGGNKEALAVFQALGITLKDSSGQLKSTQQLYAESAAKFSTYADSASKAALARDEFGKSGDKIIPLLNQEGDAAKRAQDEFDQLGGRITGQFAKDADEFTSNMTKLKTATEGWALSIAQKLLPRMIDVTNAMVEAKKAGDGFLTTMGVAIATAIGGSDEQRNQKELIALTERQLSLMNQIDREREIMAKNGGHEWGGRDIKQMQAELDRVNAQIKTTLAYRQQLDQAATDAKAREDAAAAKRTTAAPVVDKTGAANADEYARAMQTLLEKLGGLQNQTEVDATFIKVETGAWRDLTQAQKFNLLLVADEIDHRRTLGMVLQEQTVEVLALERAQQELARIQESAREGSKAHLDDLQFQNSLIGKTAAAQERLTAARQIDLKLQADLMAAAKSADQANPMFQTDDYWKTVADLEKGAAAQKEAVGQALDDNLKKQREWQTGADAAFDDYVDHATNAAEQAKTAFSSAFQTLEDLELDFVFNSGKNWESIATNFIKQILRMQLAAQNAKMFGGPAGANAQGPLDQFFGWLTSGSSNSSTAGLSAANAGWSGSAGDAAAVFQPAFATGGSFMVGGSGLTDTTPVGFQATRGERVTVETPEQQLANDGAGGPTVFIDARGADSAGMARLQNQIAALHGSIERRAVAAVGQTAMRHPAYSRVLQSH